LSDFDVMGYAAGGMGAQRSALDVLARNMATVQTATPAHPVHPLVPQFAVTGDSDGDASQSFRLALASDNPANDAFDEPAFDGAILGADENGLPGSIAFTGASPSPRAVTASDTVGEMVSVLDAQRAYEANASVFEIGKRLVERTIDVERT